MKYICVDRGSERCPCHLMEVGQCYTCTMMGKGICDCGQAAGWQGVCPYTEFIQQGGKAHPLLESFEAPILEHRVYSDELVVVKVKVNRGLAEKCRFLGTFVMAEALGYKTPLSVLSVKKEGENWTLHFAVKPAGPKTFQLLRKDCSSWRLTGPFYNGLMNRQLYDPEKEDFVIGKGTAVAPYLCAADKDRERQKNTEFYLDMDKLASAFAEDYLQGYPYVLTSLQDETQCGLLRDKLEEALVLNEKNILLLVSPYYADKLTEGLQGTERILWPNPANMCCGEGVCGACSYTDARGMTVRLCKCSRAAIK